MKTKKKSVKSNTIIGVLAHPCNVGKQVPQVVVNIEPTAPPKKLIWKH